VIVATFLGHPVYWQYDYRPITKFSIPLSHRISIQPPHAVTTHALHLMSLSSNHASSSLKVTHRSLTCFTSSLEPTSYISQDSHPNYSSPSQRPSFEHAGLTCYTLLSPSITVHCFTLSSKPTFSENLIIHFSLFLSVGLISWLQTVHRTYLLIGFIF